MSHSLKSRVTGALIKVRGSASLRNAAWTISEKAISGFGLIFVTAFVAKYIGPSLFGQLVLAAAIFQVIQIAAQMGSDGVLFKRVARRPASGLRLVRATTRLRIVTYLLLAIPTLSYFMMGKGVLEQLFFIAACLASFFTAWDAYSIYNNALLRSRVNAVTNTLGLGVAIGLRFIIAKYELAPALLTIPIIVTTLIPLLIRMHLFNRDSKVHPKGKRDFRYARYLVSAGGALVLASVSVALYARLGQLTVGLVLDSYEMGIYAAALTLTTSWSFVAVALINSFYPKIYSETDESKALKMAADLGRWVFLLCLSVLIGYAIFGRWIIEMLYGSKYLGAFAPGLFLCASITMSSLGTISYRYIIRHSGYAFLSKKMLGVLVVSLLSYYPLVSAFGITGAACGVLLIEFISLTLMNYVFKGGIIFGLHKRTLFG